MLVFDIPFQPPHNTWTISLPSGVCRAFAERHEAVQFAVCEASRLTSREGKQVYLSIEGADGKWRLFGTDLKAPGLG